MTDIVHEKIQRVITEEGEDVILRCLPKQLAEMAGLIGISSACQLATRLGGTRLTFSHKSAASRAIVNMIGPTAAAKLTEHYGREEVTLPRAHRLETFLKHRDLLRRRKEGAKVRDLALQFRLTERRIYDIIAAAQPLNPETP